MESAVSSPAPADAIDAGALDLTGEPATVADAQALFKLWLEAFTGETLTGDEAALAAVSAVIATAEDEALELLGDEIDRHMTTLVAVAERTGEDLDEAYFSSLEGVLSAIDLRLTPPDLEAASDTDSQ